MAKRKNKLNKFIVAGIIAAIVLIILNFYFMSAIKGIQPGKTKEMHLTMTEWDKAKAAQLMDMNGDGKCDACGMAIEQCVSSGMMQCTMDPKARIGLLNSAHTHADWKIYIEGKALDLSPYSHMQRMKEGKSVSSFIHVDEGGSMEKTGDIIHMHATRVPLNFFFESIGMKFEKDCLEIEGQRHCGLKMYINGEENTEYGNYEFKDLDKILITDEKGNLQEQMNSITGFAEVHE